MSTALAHQIVKDAGLELQPPCPPRRAMLLFRLHRPDLGLSSPLAQIHAQPGWPNTSSRTGLDAFSDEEKAELIFLFMRPIEECDAALDAGREQFRVQAIRAVEKALPELLIGQLVVELMQVALARVMTEPPAQANL
jgi:hypothetical protein